MYVLYRTIAHNLASERPNRKTTRDPYQGFVTTTALGQNRTDVVRPCEGDRVLDALPRAKALGYSLGPFHGQAQKFLHSLPTRRRLSAGPDKLSTLRLELR